MPEPIVVVVRRGSVVEARHRVHAVAVRDGEVVETAGDPSLVSFLRSSSKPIQALPLARAREDLDDRELAIACASHRAEHGAARGRAPLLADAPASERELECGIQEGRPPDPLHHNCSGKHAGMLALCRAHGWRSEGYRHEAHRVQRAMARGPRRGRRRRRGLAADRDRRLRRGHLRALARADRPRVRPARRAPRRRPGGRRDARSPRADRRRGPGRHRVDAGAAGLDREGRRRRADVRGGRRDRRRGQGRGRRPAARCAPRSTPSLAGSASNFPPISPACRSATRMAKRSARL